MSVTAVLMTHAIARRESKFPFFFSRFNFERMRKRNNTHYCFACLSNVGYTPGPDGEPTNHLEGDESNFHGMEHHDESHKNFVVGNADKYDNPGDWLEHELPEDFPCVVCIT